MKQVDIAIGIIVKGEQTFICLRPDNTHQGGKWEFPGGKVERGETPQQAMIRELHEEVGIQVQASFLLQNIDFKYPDKHVILHVFVVEEFSGEPTGMEGQQSTWKVIDELQDKDFPQANVAILESLKAKYKHG